jgi:hypothetical protein
LVARKAAALGHADRTNRPDRRLRPFILAEGTPAESYVEYDNRHGFHNAHEFAALYPDDTWPSFGYCLPLAEPEMPELSVIRARLFERAAALGHSAATAQGEPVFKGAALARA